MKKRPKITEKGFDVWADQLKSWISESVSPFENDTPAKQEARKERARHDLLFFCKTYLPHYFAVEFGDFHSEWEEISELTDEVIPFVAAREHAKSTFWSFAVPIRNICFVLRRFQLLISDTNDQATGFTLPIRLELEDNVRLRYDFGELRGKKWASGDFNTSNGVRILARGKGEKVRGLKFRQFRPDYACVDDFENDENVENPKLVKKGLKYLKRAVIGSMGTGFLFIMVGNLFHPQSVLAQLVSAEDDLGEKLYLSYQYDAWLDYGKENQRPLWPALWPAERLIKKERVMGTKDFKAEMMNLTGDENSPFKDENFVFFNRLELPDRSIQVATFIDPSAKNSEVNDFKAIITIEKDIRRMKYRCLHAWIRRATVGEMFKQIYAQHDMYPGRVGIEENMLQDFLHEAIHNYAKEVGRFLPWMPCHHSTNKIQRIVGTLEYLVQFGHLEFEKGHSDQRLLMEQLVYIFNATVNDDGPDALEGAVSMLQAGGSGQGDIHSGLPRETEQMLEGYM